MIDLQQIKAFAADLTVLIARGNNLSARIQTHRTELQGRFDELVAAPLSCPEKLAQLAEALDVLEAASDDLLAGNYGDAQSNLNYF